VFDISNSSDRVLDFSGYLRFQLGWCRTGFSDRYRNDRQVDIWILVDSKRTKAESTNYRQHQKQYRNRHWVSD
jgi:hypothetical protein